MTSTFSKMEDDLNFVKNGSHTHIFKNGGRPNCYQNLKLKLILGLAELSTILFSIIYPFDPSFLIVLTIYSKAD